MDIFDRIALCGVPFDAHSSFMTGPALAPSRVRECLHNGSGNYWTERGFNPIERKQFSDIGTLPFSDYLGITAAADQIIQRSEVPEHIHDGVNLANRWLDSLLK